MTDAAPDPALARRFLADPLEIESRLRAALAGTPDAREAAWRLAERIGETLGLLDCVIYLLSPGEPVLLQVAAWGRKQVAPRVFENPIRLPVGRGIVGSCARDGVPLLVADTRLDPRYVIDDCVRLSELAVPLLRRGAVIGVIDSEHGAADAYRSEHIRALQRLGDVFARHLQP